MINSVNSSSQAASQGNAVQTTKKPAQGLQTALDGTAAEEKSETPSQRAAELTAGQKVNTTA